MKPKEKPSEKEDKSSQGFCHLYKKFGVCTYGDSCMCIHPQYSFPHVLILHNIYPNPDIFFHALGRGDNYADNNTKNSLFDAFFLDIFLECTQYGYVHNMIVASNYVEPLAGTTWVFFESPDCAIAAQKGLNNRYYAGRKIKATLWDIPKISLAICESTYNNSISCPYDVFCQYIHPIEPSSKIKTMCFSRTISTLPVDEEKFEKKPNISPDSIVAEVLNNRKD